MMRMSAGASPAPFMPLHRTSTEHAAAPPHTAIAPYIPCIPKMETRPTPKAYIEIHFRALCLSSKKHARKSVYWNIAEGPLGWTNEACDADRSGDRAASVTQQSLNYASATFEARRDRAAPPIIPKPTSIIAHVAVSGTDATKVPAPYRVRPLSTFVARMPAVPASP